MVQPFELVATGIHGRDKGQAAFLVLVRFVEVIDFGPSFGVGLQRELGHLGQVVRRLDNVRITKPIHLAKWESIPCFEHVYLTDLNIQFYKGNFGTHKPVSDPNPASWQRVLEHVLYTAYPAGRRNRERLNWGNFRVMFTEQPPGKHPLMNK